uniref:Terpene synthase n=1 Tax=Clitopilus sp. TaxID=1967123 RepID=A0A4P2VIB5_9AGAR|nr:putative sesquiterpene synthase [Clitopilus sp.]
MLTTPYFTIPDTLRNWPWKRVLNPHQKVCEEEAADWMRSCGAFTPKSQNAFDRCSFGLLGSLAYPRLGRDGLRIACDLMNMFFVIDEYSDVASGREARLQADIVMDALYNPLVPRPVGEWIGGEVTRQFWANAIKTATPSSQRRFVRNFQRYVDAVVQQAQDREAHCIRDVKSYFILRRQTIGAIPSLDLLTLEMDLEDEVLDHPIIAKLLELCVDMILIGNDLYSYNVEQARGDDTHNFVRIVKDERKCNLNDALRWISDYHDRLADEFLNLMHNLPSFGSKLIDEQVKTYVDGLGNWVRANECWSFESERYFGKKGKLYQKSRRVRLLPSSIALQGQNIDPQAAVEISDLPAAAGIIV